MAITTKRPSSDYKVVGAAPAGGPVTVAGATSDNNVLTYAVGVVDSGFALLNMEDTSLVGVRLKSVQLRVQARNNGLGGAELQTAWARLRDPVDGQVSGQVSMPKGTTTLTEFRGPVEFTAPGRRAWGTVVWNRMQVEVAWKKSPAGHYLQVVEIIANLDTNTQPSVSGVTVTGASATTRPDVAFDYADVDGDPQARARVKVFSAAQYGAAGFDPSTSPATWDSGDLFGGVDTVQVLVDLVNGTTYRAYVQAAQEWQGPQGELWWSGWAQSANFTIQVVPPISPALVAALDPSLPGYRVLLRAVASLNLATANQATLDTDTAGWAPLANCSISRSTAWTAHSPGSLQMSSTAAGTMTAEWSTRPFVAAGATYTAMATMRSAAAARTVRVGIRWFDQAGALLSTSFGAGAVSATGSDTTVSVTAAAPATALTAAEVVEVQATGGAGELHRWDKHGLRAGTSATWSLGGERDAPTVQLQRLLKVISDRGDAKNWAHPQLASGGGLTRGTDGFYARQSSLLRSAPIEGPHPGGTAHAGARMIVWRPLVGAFNGLDIGLNNQATNDDTPPYLMPAVPGRAQTLSVYARGSAAVSARVFVIPVDATNTQVGAGTEVPSGTAVLPTAAGAWARYATTITPPAGTVYLRGFFELPSGNADVDVQLTGVQAELGAAATALAPGSGMLLPAWETVRELEVAAPVSPGETYTAWDHEAPPGRPVLYRARTVAGPLASTPSAPLATYLDPPARNLLKDPHQPENAVIVNVDPRWSESRSRDQQVFRPLGRDAAALGTADPVVHRSWLGGQDASYTLTALSEDGLARLRFLLASPRPLLLQHYEGGQRYLVAVEDETTERVAAGTFRVAVRTVGVGRPA